MNTMTAATTRLSSLENITHFFKKALTSSAPSPAASAVAFDYQDVDVIDEAKHRFWGTPNDAKYVPSPKNLVVDKTVIVHRHGDRAPINSTIGNGRAFRETRETVDFWTEQLPTRARTLRLQNSLAISGPAEASDQNCQPWGWLTDVGVDQLETIGSSLRHRFVNKLGLLPKKLPSNKEELDRLLRVRSTNTSRTRLSVASLLMGIYPEHLREQNTVPKVHIMDPNKETMYPINSCLRHRELMWEKRFSNHEGADREWRGNPITEVQYAISKVLGVDPAEYLHWPAVKEILTCHHLHGKELPRELQDISWAVEDAMEIAGWEWAVMYDDFEMRRLGIGRFVGDLLDDLDDPTGPVVQIFSGHDSTIIPLLAAMGQNDGGWPPYASTIGFERATSALNGERHMRVLFNDEVLQLPNSSKGWVKFEDFVSQLKPLVFKPGEFERDSVPHGTIEIPAPRHH